MRKYQKSGMRYIKLACGVILAGAAYFIMFVQFILYSDESIGLSKLIIRELVSLIFVLIGLYLVFEKKKRPDKSEGL